MLGLPSRLDPHLEESVQSIDLIHDNLTKSRDRVLSKIEEMREHGFVFPTPNGGGHTVWVLGHLAYIEGLVIQEFMLGGPNPLADWREPFDGDDVSGDPGRYPPFDVVLDRCREMRAATLRSLGGFSEDDLGRPSHAAPDGTAEMFGTYRLCFQFVSDHWYMHRGQLADARRAARIDRMWY